MEYFNLSFIKQMTMLFFCLFFVGVILWAFFSRRAKQFPTESRLPLEEGQLASTPDSRAKETRNV